MSPPDDERRPLAGAALTDPRPSKSDVSIDLAVTNALSREVTTLEAYRDDRLLWVWCDHEQVWHRHGAGCTCPDYLADHPDPEWDGLCRCVGQGDGHRGAHCWCPRSPYWESGYVLREVGPFADEHRNRPESSYIRGCRTDSCRLDREARRRRVRAPQQLPPPDDPLAVAHLLLKGFADVDYAYADPTYDGVWFTYTVSRQTRDWFREGALAAGDEEEVVQAAADADNDDDLVELVPHLEYEPEWDGPLTLRRWRGQWYQWDGTRWSTSDDDELEAELYRRLGDATFVKQTKSGLVSQRWKPNSRSVREVLAAMEGPTLLRGHVEVPTWLSLWNEHEPTTLISCANGLLDVATGQLREHDPDWFSLVSVPFPYEAEAPAPTRWLRFLTELWPDDPTSIDALQEWFGYVLSGRTDLQKMLLVVGPPRSGKGTIVHVLEQLVGRGNHAGPTLASLGTNFGLQALVDKPLAVVADARLGGRDTHIVVERLLSISGEDTLTVDRKYRDAWSGRLPTRLMVLSNELPHFGDASGAIATRFVALQLTRSWLGHEDLDLKPALDDELPGILRWALAGLQRLAGQKRFSEPPTSGEAIVAMADSASPTGAFVRDLCQVGAGHTVPARQLYAAWKGWCLENGREHPGNEQTFGRTLRSVVPTLRSTRPRDPATGQQVRTYEGIGLSRSETRLNLMSSERWQGFLPGWSEGQEQADETTRQEVATHRDSASQTGAG
jgi:putative DNA primase/helicase